MGILDSPGMKKIEIQECGETLVVLDPQEFLLVPMYYQWGYAYTPEIKLRNGAIKKLREAKTRLNKIPGCEGWNFKIWDGFRTLKTQNFLYENYWGVLKARHPEWSDDQLKTAVQVFVSLPSHDPKLPAPHNTGGAVDLTLVDELGREMPMGTAFDEFNVRSFTGHFEGGRDDVSKIDDLQTSGTPMPFSQEECKEFDQNRRLLRQVLEEVGFVNYPEEWWHFSYGDQAWAKHKEQPAAIYGSMELNI